MYAMEQFECHFLVTMVSAPPCNIVFFGEGVAVITMTSVEWCSLSIGSQPPGWKP